LIVYFVLKYCLNVFYTALHISRQPRGHAAADLPVIHNNISKSWDRYV